MRQNLKFALAYTFVLPLPVALVLGSVAAFDGGFAEMLDVMMGHGRFLFWLWAIGWPWIFVIVGYDPQSRPRRKREDDA